LINASSRSPGPGGQPVPVKRRLIHLADRCDRWVNNAGILICERNQEDASENRVRKPNRRERQMNVGWNSNADVPKPKVGGKL